MTYEQLILSTPEKPGTINENKLQEAFQRVAELAATVPLTIGVPWKTTTGIGVTVTYDALDKHREEPDQEAMGA